MCPGVREVRVGVTKAPQEDPNRRLLDALSTSQLRYASAADPREVFGQLLETLLELSQSAYGFIGEVFRDADGTPWLKTHSITDISWNEETRTFYEQGVASGLEFRNLETLFGRVMVTGEPVIANDPAHDPRRGGLPEGHPSLDAFLGLPIRSKAELLGMIGIANRPGGYDEEIVQFLQPFLMTCAGILTALRSDRKRTEAESSLRESEIRNRAIIDGVLDAIVTIDNTGLIEQVNPAAEQLFGYTVEELVGENVSLLMPEPHRSRHDRYIQTYLSTGETKVIGVGREVEGQRKDGSTFPMELTITHLKVRGSDEFTAVIRDISERISAERRLTQLNDELSTQLRQMDEVNIESQILSEMSSFLQACETEEEVNLVVSSYWMRLFPGRSGGFFLLREDGTVTQAVRWGDSAGEPEFLASSCWALRRGVTHVTRTGNPNLVCSHLPSSSSTACMPVMSRGGPIGLLSMWGPHRSDTEPETPTSQLEAFSGRLGPALSNVRLRQRLREESIRDPLTHLFNRRYLQQALKRELRRSKRLKRPVSVVILDIDHFKRFNDDHGHDAGDLVLQEVGRILQDRIRIEDVASRLGGEEFLLLLGGCSTEFALDRAEEIRRGIALIEAIYRGNRLPPITVSAGVATCSTAQCSAERLLAAADAALYRAKEAGRDRVEAVAFEEAA